MDLGPLLASDAPAACLVDLETLQFRGTNHRAEQLYGFGEPEFQNMGIADLCLENDLQRLANVVTQPKAGLADDGIWEHRRVDGHTIAVHQWSVRVEDEALLLLVTPHIRPEQSPTTRPSLSASARGAHA